MRIGITGASGLIGAAFIKLATASDHEVVAYSRQDAQIPHASRTLQIPTKAPHQLPETQLDALVHLSGEPLASYWSKSKKELIWKSRVDLTHALMKHVQHWAPSNQPGIVLGASGIGFYGSRGDSLLDETRSKGTGFLADLCEKWEEATNQAQSWRARVVNLRTSMVLSITGGAYPSLSKVFRAGLGGNLGSGRQWMSWIHVDDQAAMMLWALENNFVNGPLNLCAPNPVLNSVFTQKLAQHLKRPAFLHVPAMMMRLLLRDMADEMLLCSQRAIPKSASQQGYRFAYPELGDALSGLTESHFHQDGS